MDELTKEISKTNELLTELLRRQEQRAADSEARMKEFAAMQPNILGGQANESIEERLKRMRGPDFAKRIEEAKAQASAQQAKHEDAQETMIRVMEEQNALLRSILEKLNR